MIRRMRPAAAATAAAVAMVALAGCAIITPTAPVKTPSALEACAHGTTWALDMPALQAQVVALFAESGIGVSEVLVEGSQTLDWDENGHVTIESAYTVTAKAGSDIPDVPFVVTQTVNGTTTGRAYFSDVIAVPRNWDADGLTIETSAVRGEEALESAPFSIPRTAVDDTVGIEVVCSPEQMTMHPRGTHLTLTWVPAG